MGLAEALDSAFSILRSHLSVFAAIALLGGAVPLALIHESGGSTATGAVDSWSALLGWFGLIPLALTAAAATIAVSDDFLSSDRVTLKRALARGLERLWPVLGASMILGLLLILGLAVRLVALMAGLGSLSAVEGPGSFIGGVVLSLTGLMSLGGVGFVAAGLLLYTPIVVIEGLGPIRSLARCWSLMRNHRPRVVGLVLIWLLLSFGSSLLIALMPQVPIVTSLVMGSVESLLNVFIAVAQVVIYFDIRARTESFDIEQLASEVERVSRKVP